MLLIVVAGTATIGDKDGKRAETALRIFARHTGGRGLGWMASYFLYFFFACPKKSNKRKGTTMTNHKLLLRTCLRVLPQNLWFALIVDSRPRAMDAWLS